MIESKMNVFLLCVWYTVELLKIAIKVRMKECVQKKFYYRMFSIIINRKNLVFKYKCPMN